jgi:hypothetical protein
MTSRDVFITFAPLIALIAIMMVAFGTQAWRDRGE